MSVKPIPDGYNTITPYLVVKDVDQLLDFCKKAFNAVIKYQSKTPDGSTTHAEFIIGDSIIMTGKARNENEVNSSMLYMYTKHTDAVYEKALSHGATSIMEPADQFYGDRNAGVMFPQGISWWIATHVEDVSEEEMARRAREQKS